MGNACFTNTKHCIQKHLDICADKNISNLYVEESFVDENKSNNKINKLKDYFIKGEKEISDNLIQKNMRATAQKKRNSGFVNLILIDKNKYETMLKKLLEQKSIVKKGPKRRETLRAGNKINILVKEVMKEKKDNKNNKLKRAHSKRRHSIIIKNKDSTRIRQSTTLNRKEPVSNKSPNKILRSQPKKANTLNEILTDGNMSTVFNKKETYKV